MLAELAPGSEVVGGGTEFTPEEGPLSCDPELALRGDEEEALRVAISTLESLGTPVGSWAESPDGEQIPFGVTHGLTLALDKISLPDDVYEQNDINELIATLQQVLGEHGSLLSWWQSEERTSLHFYGKDADRLRSVLESAPQRFALAENSVVSRIT